MEGKSTYLIAVMLLLFSCLHKKVKVEDFHVDTLTVIPNAEKGTKRFELRTYLNTESKTSGWGYDIYMDNKLYVHQPNIPAISGERGFETKEQAQKVGDFVIYKIKSNVIPPTMSKEELDSLKAN